MPAPGMEDVKSEDPGMEKSRYKSRDKVTPANDEYWQSHELE